MKATMVAPGAGLRIGVSPVPGAKGNTRTISARAALAPVPGNPREPAAHACRAGRYWAEPALVFGYASACALSITVYGVTP